MPLRVSGQREAGKQLDAVKRQGTVKQRDAIKQMNAWGQQATRRMERLSKHDLAMVLGLAGAILATRILVGLLRGRHNPEEWTDGSHSFSEPGSFAARLDVVGPNKTPVIKMVRAVTGVDRKTAKDLVGQAARSEDAAGRRVVVRANLSKESAAAVKAALEEQGAQVTVV